MTIKRSKKITTERTYLDKLLRTVTTLALVLFVAFGASACTANVEQPAEVKDMSAAPECDPSAPGTVTFMAPESIEITQCREVLPIEQPALNIGRREWCCLQGQAPDIKDLK